MGQLVLEGHVPPPRRLTRVVGEHVLDESLIVNPANMGIANICQNLHEAPAATHPSFAMDNCHWPIVLHVVTITLRFAATF